MNQETIGNKGTDKEGIKRGAGETSYDIQQE